MPFPDTSMNANPPSLWQGQQLHWVSLLFLLPITHWLWFKIGGPAPTLFWITIAIPIVHQVYVWLTWRLELKSQAVSNSVGLKFYLFFFFLLLLARPVFVGELAWVDQGSLGMSKTLRIILCSFLGIIWLYTAYSIKKYFGFYRAAGADHFDETFRKKDLVKEGIFKHTSNAMYVAGFFILWILALAFDSQSALIAAAFNHIYIWVHYFATEKPDMEYLYGGIS